MAIAIVAALASHYSFLSPKFWKVGRGRTAIRHFIGLLPATATVRRNESWQDVETRRKSLLAIFVLKPGTRIPVDGIVAGGHSFVDQATITGASMSMPDRSISPARSKSG